MANYDFPNAPTLGQEVIAPLGAAYRWDGAVWRAFPGVPAGNDYVGVSGDTMTGPLTLSGNATTPLQAVPLQQVNSIVANYLPLVGGHVTGALQVDGATQLNATLSMGQPAPAGADPGQVFVTNLSSSSNILWNAYSVNGGNNWFAATTGPSATASVQSTALTFYVAPSAAAGSVPAFSQRLDLRNDIPLVEVSGNLLAESSSNPVVGVWNQAAGAASGITCPDAARYLCFTGLNGDGTLAGQLGFFDTGGNLTITGGETMGGQGIRYASYGGHVFAFAWDGSFVNGIVDGTNVGQFANTNWVNGNFATYGWVNAQGYANANWVNSNFATYNWVNGNFYPASTTDGRYLYKSGDTCTGSLTVNGTVDCYQTIHSHNDIHADTAIVGQYLITTGTGGDYWQFWHQSGGGIYVRMDGAYDYGPVNYASDARLKQGLAPIEIDCLALTRRLELQQFRWKETDELVRVGFTTQQLSGVLSDLVNAEPKDRPPMASDEPFYESVNLLSMLALLAGAIQQLDRRLTTALETK